MLLAIALAGWAQSTSTETISTPTTYRSPTATPTTILAHQTRLYVAVTNSSVSPGQTSVEALDPATCAVLWPGTAHVGNYGTFLQVAGGVVYALISNGNAGVLVALDGADGRQLWQVTSRAANADAATMDTTTGQVAYLTIVISSLIDIRPARRR
jgi:outer membrane protein assembly factor BamB